MKNLYLFDIDGTLANIDHRRVHLQDGKNDWKTFNSLMAQDTPNDQIFRIFKNMFFDHSSDNSIGIPLLVSGRSNDFRYETFKWVRNHLGLIPSFERTKTLFESMYMRPSGDYRPDEVVKKDLLFHIRKDYPNKKIMGVFDDRPKVIKMWRENGLFVFDCSQGVDDF